MPTIVTITGILVADQWDSNDTIAGLALLTDKEDKYLIRPEELGEDFTSLLRRKVEITGVITGLGAEKWLRVIDYQLLLPWLFGSRSH